MLAPWRDRDRVLAAATGWVRDAADAAGQPDHAVYAAEQDGIVAGLVSVSERRHFTGQSAVTSPARLMPTWGS